MLKRTPLYEYHIQHGKMIEFAGYDMPAWFTSISDEHLAVRNGAGIFDVSHMGRVNVSGRQSGAFIESLVPTSTTSQPPGKSFYTLMLNSGGGIIDDLIIIKRPEGYLLVINAANRTKDLEHILSHSSDFDVAVEDITDSTTMIAVQGPSAVRALQPLTTTALSEIKKFMHADSVVGSARATITRTGYTGEDGFEVILHRSGIDDNSAALSVWGDLAERTKPCGLGARDSLRIESGLPLYGNDIDETTNPVEADLQWVISREKKGYVGAESVTREMTSPPRRLRRGVVLDDKIPRQGFAITNATGDRIGEVTSGSFSPILKKGIAMAYLDLPFAQVGQLVKVLVRNSPTDGKVVKPPFYDQRLYGWKRTAQQNI